MFLRQGKWDWRFWTRGKCASSITWTLTPFHLPGTRFFQNDCRHRLHGLVLGTLPGIGSKRRGWLRVTSTPEQTHGGVVALLMGTATALSPATCNCDHNILLCFKLERGKVVVCGIGAMPIKQGSSPGRYSRYKEHIWPCEGDQYAVPLVRASKVSHPTVIIDFPLFYRQSDIMCVIWVCKISFPPNKESVNTRKGKNWLDHLKRVLSERAP
jgi:hypothetical protein